MREDLESKVPLLDLMPVVRDIQKVFPDDLLRVSHDLELDFGIELFQDTKSILIPLYRMASVELEELMF